MRNREVFILQNLSAFCTLLRELFLHGENRLTVSEELDFAQFLKTCFAQFQISISRSC